MLEILFGKNPSPIEMIIYKYMMVDIDPTPEACLSYVQRVVAGEVGCNDLYIAVLCGWSGLQKIKSKVELLPVKLYCKNDTLVCFVEQNPNTTINATYMWCDEMVSSVDNAKFISALFPCGYLYRDRAVGIANCILNCALSVLGEDQVREESVQACMRHIDSLLIPTTDSEGVLQRVVCEYVGQGW